MRLPSMKGFIVFSDLSGFVCINMVTPCLQVMEEADGAPLREEDAADRDARLLAEQAARDEAEFRKRSQAVRRDLPRPG